MSTTQTDDLTNELQQLTEESRRRRYLHYVPEYRPLAQAICGKRPPRGGWWSNKETEAKAAVDSWEICPTCQVKYSALPAGGEGRE